MAASLNYSGQLSIGLNYTSISLGGSQARAACVLDDDQNWIADDKGDYTKAAWAVAHRLAQLERI